MTTANTRGARTVAPTLSPATPTTPEAQPRVAGDAETEFMGRSVLGGGRLSKSQRRALAGAGSREDAPASLAADLGLVGFCDYRALAAAILDFDADQVRVIEQATAIAKNEAARPDDVALFLSKLRALRGAIPQALAGALGVPASAPWGAIADVLAARLGPKAGGVR